MVLCAVYNSHILFLQLAGLAQIQISSTLDDKQQKAEKNPAICKSIAGHNMF